MLLLMMVVMRMTMSAIMVMTTILDHEHDENDDDSRWSSKAIFLSQITKTLTGAASLHMQGCTKPPGP